MTSPLFDNICWQTLAGSHAVVATGTSTARRYAPGFSPIVAFADNEHPDFAALRPYCEPGEHYYCAGWSGRVPAGWQLEAETAMHLMVWAGGLPGADEAFDPIRLDLRHVAPMLELVALTQPGPFGPRTVELGEYLGCFDGSALVALAGERMCAGSLREISGVCVHPEFQGRGLARRLVERLIRNQMRRDETPFLHVMNGNDHARCLYERMGFRRERETVVRILSRCS